MSRPMLLLFVGALIPLCAPSCSEPQDEPSRPEREKHSFRKPSPNTNRASAPKQDTVEALADEFGLNLERMNRSIEAVKDVASARAALESVTLITDEFLGIAQRLEKLEIPSDDIKRRINDKMEARHADPRQSPESRAEFMKNLPDDARPIVAEALRTFRDTMKELDPIMSDYFSE